MKLKEDDKVISMAIIKGVEATAEERDDFLSIPFDRRQEITLGNHDFSEDEFEVGLSKEQIIDLASKEEFLLTVTENGFGKRTSTFHYRVTNRGGSGIVNMQLAPKTGDVVASMPANLNDELMMITNNGKLIRAKLETVRVTGRSTSGVILFKTEKGENVVSASLIAEEEEIEGEDKSEEVNNHIENNDISSSSNE
jgi:DNA gyrase subunit A